MTAALLAGAALTGLIVFAGQGCTGRLSPRSGARPGRWRLPARGRSAASLSAAALDVPAGLALELRSGRDLPGALAALADELADHDLLAERLRRAGSASRGGEPVGPVLTAGPEPDDLGRALSTTAACCDVSTESGLPLADVLAAVAEAARTREVLVGRAKAELAGARSTAVVLACLPLAGLAMGQLLGARPLHVLLGTGWGAGCLAFAVLLTGAGLAWSRLISAAVERTLP